MKVIVDANMFIKALINKKGIVGDIILDPFNRLQKLSCHYLYVEILKHKDKIIKYSKLTEDDFLDLFYIMIKKITFYNEVYIKKQIWEKAEQLTSDIDNKDISYVALTLQKDGKLWTADKRLTKGLKAKGFDQFITTNELFELISK